MLIKNLFRPAVRLSVCPPVRRAVVLSFVYFVSVKGLKAFYFLLERYVDCLEKSKRVKPETVFTLSGCCK